MGDMSDIGIIRHGLKLTIINIFNNIGEKIHNFTTELEWIKILKLKNIIGEIKNSITGEGKWVNLEDTSVENIQAEHRENEIKKASKKHYKDAVYLSYIWNTCYHHVYY